MAKKNQKEGNDVFGEHNQKPIVKKNATVNVGSSTGGTDGIFNLVAGQELPDEIDSKFYTSFEVDGII